ncbi:AbiV family abortive infection protein [Tenacibaculum maritimum]|uniref:AbiV family abortive infection protein n=1 Tax=Tenacibaculum maritimum TaxID=107401 RepID=UPI0012E4BA43|nr:AbiV family abortive infection protein [Tenacibaculum maritimum]CAA0184885.1 AbiV family abortive infection protein [Tenacibaculum maritimum]
MKNFISLSSKDSIGLDKPIFKNGLQLIKDAKLLGIQHQSYSSATSLSILGLEEIVKATLVLLHSNNVKVYKLKGAKRFFTDHKIRHEVVQLIETGLGLYEAYEKWEYYKVNKRFKTKSKWFNLVFNEIHKGWKTLTPILNTYERVNQIEDFDNLKNKGFYVDYKDDVLIPNKEINKSIYNSVLTSIERVIKFYKIVRIFHHPSIKKHISEEELLEFNSSMKSFIEDTMSKYEFKKYPKLILDKEQ